MGLTLRDENILHPEKLDDMVRDLAASGFEIIRPFLRNVNFTHRSPETVKAIARLVSVAHSLGLKVALDCEPHILVAKDMAGSFPGSMSLRLVRAQGRLVNGHFKLHVEHPSGSSRPLDFLRIEAAFLDEGGSFRPVEIQDYGINGEGEIYETGYTFSEHYYKEGRPAARRMHTHLWGQLPSTASGQLIVYATFKDVTRIDFWSQGCKDYYDDMLECYRDIPLDGVGWDEPATDGDWGQYLYGEAFAAAFSRLNGYELKSSLHLLDAPGTSSASLKVRLDYYRTLNEGLYEAQRNLALKAKSLFGDNVILGSHHTWQGEGNINDYRAGASDYFRLNDNMDAGYTDCCWWDPKSVAYAYTLASSLGRLTPSGEAEVNTWHWKPTNSLTIYNARLISLYDITWFNIFYGEGSEVARYPAHYTWPHVVAETKRNRDLQRIIGRARPVTDVAILHGWETICGVNQPGLAGAHKTFCLNTAELFVEQSIAFDWVDTRLLSDGRVEGGRFVSALGSYSILILPYASFLPRQAWENCKAFAQAGGKLVFVGPPPDRDLSGESLRADFAELLASPELSLEEYLEGVNAVATLPPYRPESLDVGYPLSGEEARLLCTLEGEPHGMRSPSGNCVYLSDLDPRRELLDVITPWLTSDVACFSDTILWRLYREESRSLLILISRKDRELSGLVRVAGHSLEFSGGTIARVTWEEGHVPLVEGVGVSVQIKPIS